MSKVEVYPKNFNIELNSNSEFVLKIDLQEPEYFKLGPNTIFLKPGDRLLVKIDCNNRKNSTFNGNSSEECNYLRTIPEFSQVDIGYLGKNYEFVKRDLSEFTNSIMLPQVNSSMVALERLKSVPDIFKEREAARIKSNVVMSIMLYTAGYSRKFIENFDVVKDRELFAKLRGEHIEFFKDMLMEYGKDLAKEGNIVLPEFRKIVVWVTDTSGSLLPAYKKIDRIEDYNLVSQLIQKYASCFTSYPSDKKPDDVLAELNEAKSSISTQLYKDLIDDSINEYSIIKKGSPAFDFTGYDINNKPVKLSQFKGKYIYLDFWATWCGPCRILGPVVDALSQEMKGLKFGKVNVDEQPELSEKFGVASIPTLLLLKNGKMIANRVGATTKENLKEWINASMKG